MFCKLTRYTINTAHIVYIAAVHQARDLYKGEKPQERGWYDSNPLAHREPSGSRVAKVERRTIQRVTLDLPGDTPFTLDITDERDIGALFDCLSEP